eukprot:TRINITY_DN136546_c0_g1_i1.p1 TRINITY_DN136546_c0_g1~~TRINITY_DN136546_c0_g1_i1.p1  ORF type:complete len:83 (+),score=15.82 TRINITY_DN136546_c0_g1_i1:22-270(+)
MEGPKGFDPTKIVKIDEKELTRVTERFSTQLKPGLKELSKNWNFQMKHFPAVFRAGISIVAIYYVGKCIGFGVRSLFYNQAL